MKRLVTIVAPAILLIGLLLLGLSDTATSIADTSVPENEGTSNVTKARNSSATATITITMTGVLNQ